MFAGVPMPRGFGRTFRIQSSEPIHEPENDAGARVKSWAGTVTSGSRRNEAATRRRIARRRRVITARSAGSRVASHFDKDEPSKGSAPREEAREDLLAEESSESGHV